MVIAGAYAGGVETVDVMGRSNLHCWDNDSAEILPPVEARPFPDQQR